MSEMLSGAEILCRALVDGGVEVIFGYPGGAIMPFYHALPDHPRLRHILVRHEQAAAHAADGYARASGRVGVCVATSGPGATNLVTGLAAAHMDNSPVVAITGQVSRPMIGRDAFQETDIIGITLPITKKNYLVQDVTELAGVVADAMAVAVEGRPGPVLIDVPKDVQNQKIEYGAPQARARGQSRPQTPGASPGLEDGVHKAARLIAGAERPLIMVGHGVILAQAYAEVRALAEKTGIPVITTLLGISAFPDGHPLHLGMPGMHGEVHVNRAIQHADVIIGIGLRFDDRGLGAMGFAVPAAMGVHLARPRGTVWAISGDGGFQMNMAEMATMVQEGLPVKMAVFNNGYLGMVRQWQQFFHEKRYSCTPIWSPDYVKLAEAYGIPGYRVGDASELAETVGQANTQPGPALVEFMIEQEANVFPMIPPGGSLSEPIETAPAGATGD